MSRQTSICSIHLSNMAIFLGSKRRGDGECRLEKILNAFLDLTGQDGRDHLFPPEFMPSLYEADKGILHAYIRVYRQKRPAGFLSSD